MSIISKGSRLIKDSFSLMSTLPLDLEKNPLFLLPESVKHFLEVISKEFDWDEINSMEEEYLAFLDEEEDEGFDITEGVAIIPVQGTLLRKSVGLFEYLFGLSSYEGIKEKFRGALSDSKVKSILFDIHSPGGVASGMVDLSDEIYNSRGEKPIYAHANDFAYSAAYGIASAADKVFITKTGGVGSVGVIGMHVDQSEYNKDQGIKVTPIFAGKRKNDFSPHFPLSEEAKKRYQQDVDDHYAMFTGAVARNLDVPESEIIGTEAATYMGPKAVEAGLAHEVISQEELLGRMLEEVKGKSDSRLVTHNLSLNVEKFIGKEVKSMSSLEELKAENPELYKELMDSAQETVRKAIESEFSGREQNLLSEIGELTKSVGTLKDQVLDFEKKEVIRSDREMKLVGESIWVKLLADSDIPEYMHEKIVLHVPYSRFVQDSVLDEVKFKEAIKVEIEDWEKKGLSRTVLGTGFNSDNVNETGDTELEATEKVEDKKVSDNLLKLAGQEVQAA